MASHEHIDQLVRRMLVAYKTILEAGDVRQKHALRVSFSQRNSPQIPLESHEAEVKQLSMEAAQRSLVRKNGLCLHSDRT